jgi:WD40 repeat protein
VIAALTRFDARPNRRLHLPRLWNEGAAAFDGDLRRMVLLDRDRVLRVLAVADGKELFQTEAFRGGPPHRINDGLSLTFTRDGNSVIVGRSVTPDHDELWIWDLRQAGQPPRRLLHDEIFLPPVVMADGETLAVVRREGGIQSIDLTTGLERRRWAVGLRGCWFDFSPDGKRIAFGLHDGPYLIVWNAESDREAARFTLPDRVYGVAWNHDGKLVAAGCGDHQAYVFDTQLKRQHSVLSGHRMAPMRVAFAQPGDWLVSWDADLNLIVSDPISGKSILSVRGDVRAIGRDGRRWIVYDTEGHSEWEVGTPSANRVIRHRFALGDPVQQAWMEGPRSVDISPDSRLLATSDLDGLRLFDMSTFHEIAWMPMLGSHAAFFDAAGNLYSSSSGYGLLRWPLQIQDGRDVAKLRVGRPQPFGPSVRDDRPPFFFDAARSWMLVGDAPSTENRLLRTPDGVEEGPVFRRNGSMLRALDIEGRWVVTADVQEAETVVWDARRRVVIHSWPHDSWGRFSPCGRWLLLRFAGTNEFRLFRSETWTFERAFTCRDSSYSIPAISPDGRMIALCDHRAIRLLDFETFTPLAELPTGPGNIEYVGCVFSPDGSQLVSARRGHVAIVWDLRTIRSLLKRRDLDWHLPPYRPPQTAVPIVQADVPFILPAWLQNLLARFLGAGK